MKKTGLALLVVCMSLAAAAAVPGKSKKGKKSEDSDKPHAPEYMVLLVEGHAAFIVNDHEKALGLYKEAAEKSPKSPKPHYFIGCAERALGNFDAALDSFKTAFLMASDDPWWKGVASMNIAITQESAGRLEKAKSAWKDFKRLAEEKAFLKKYVETADARIEAIDRYIELDKKYEKVRQKIAEEKESE